MIHLLAANVFWCCLMAIPFIWLADLLGLWQRWQTSIEDWLRKRRP